MVLPAQPAVMIHLLGNMHLVAQRTEFGAAMKRLQPGFLVKFRFGADQLVIDGLQQGRRAVGERIGRWVDYCVRSVAAHAVQFGDGMAGDAGNASLRCRIRVHVIGRVIETSAEQRDRIMASRAEA